MWRALLGLTFGLLAAGAGWFFLSAYFGSEHTIYDCNGQLSSKSAGSRSAAVASMDLEHFYWFTMRIGEIAGMADIELPEPPLFQILYAFRQGEHHLNLHQIPASGEQRGTYAGGFSQLSRSLVVQLSDDLVFDGRCLPRPDGR